MVSLGFPTDSLGGLPTHPPTIELVASVMGGRSFAMRHINAQLFRCDAAGNTWHHDYPCGPPSNPYTVDHGQLSLDRKMCHALYYPEGLDGTIGAMQRCCRRCRRCRRCCCCRCCQLLLLLLLLLRRLLRYSLLARHVHDRFTNRLT